MIGEIAARIYFKIRKGSGYSIQDLRREKGADPSFALDRMNGCLWVESLYPHPNLGIIQSGLPPCGRQTSNLSLPGKDLPWNKLDDQYVLLVLGGSVAQQATSLRPPFRESWIEEYLNSHYLSPNGKPFYVVNGALSSWKQPNQMILLMQVIDRIDGFISIEGYNEAHTIDRGVLLEAPFPTYQEVGSLPDVPMRLFPLLIKKIRKTIAKEPALKNSFLVNLFFADMLGYFRALYKVESQNSYHNKIYEYPKDWDIHKKIKTGINKYADYINSMDSVARSFKKKGVVFLQPIPNLYKTLAPHEWPPGAGIRSEIYLELEKKMSSLQLSSIKIESLLKIFENEKRLIYIDDIHPEVDENGESYGYSLMAKQVGDRLAKTWGLKSLNNDKGL